ncbi:hypothetical protein ASC97_29730 [Rhizobium sp. Root1203]|uniref:DUF6522 family protein n=1 Tax=Rhizobium sp. Root1203 TaxID=1736427 RepID=UPI00070C592E|nr:DUF6522 family protein [Rhizobium sp. Root1203]KQV18245.1 hypothetical protein ASC97_29730 [Rhizobium sp. Root1203]
MKFIRDADGNFVVEAEQVASKFGLTPEAMRNHLKRGALVSVVEKGTGADDGNSRLSLRLGNRTWRAIIGPDFEVVAEEQLWCSAGHR